ncbi:MAG: hypothetical protein OHK0013_43450 [Sandaracinaceae bacterium]
MLSGLTMSDSTTTTRCLLAAALLQVGCYGAVPRADGGAVESGVADTASLPVDALSGPDAFRPSDRRVCATDEDCRSGEFCVLFLTQEERLCARPCSNRYEACDDGLACRELGELPREMVRNACYPGAASPGPTCRHGFDCGPGQRCARPGPYANRWWGECTTRLCRTHVDCPEGDACRAAACQPACDDRVAGSCPEGFICKLGECLTPRDAAYCFYGRVSCELGYVCVASTIDGHEYCVRPEEQHQYHNCPEGRVYVGFPGTGWIDEVTCVVPRRVER